MAQQTVTVDECAQACYDCKRECERTVSYCLVKGGKHAEARHIQLLMDCIAMCETCGSSCERESETHHTLCKACAEIATRCAEDCETFKGDEQMQACAKACRACAETCEAMA